MPWDDRPRDPQIQRGFDLIGAMIRRRRVWLGWTQRDLARRSEIHQSVISRIENGKQYGLRWVRFAELINALGGLDIPVQQSSFDSRPLGAWQTIDPEPSTPRLPRMSRIGPKPLERFDLTKNAAESGDAAESGGAAESGASRRKAPRAANGPGLCRRHASGWKVPAGG